MADFFGQLLNQMMAAQQQQQQQQGPGGAGRGGGGGAGGGGGGGGGGMPFMMPQNFNPSALHEWAANLARHPGVDADGWEQPPAEWLQENHEPDRGPPPTAKTFLRRLPDVTVCPEDLAVETSCLICLEEHVIGSKALKLPCNHLFHRDCVIGWLERHCTCPVCRFELETEDPQFEAERRKRMRRRKLRFRAGELERKGVSELKRIFETVGLSTRGCIDKTDMIQALLESGMAELIQGDGASSSSPRTPLASPSSAPSSPTDSSPPPPTPPASEAQAAPPTAPPSSTTTTSTSSSSSSGQSHTVSSLRQMKVSQLKALMKDVGVSSANCVEKDDLMNALITSGRITMHVEEEVST